MHQRSVSPARTYQDLIQSKHDGEVFEYYTTHCLYVVEPEPTEDDVNASFISKTDDGDDSSSINSSTLSVASKGGGVTTAAAAAAAAASEPILKLLGDPEGKMYTSISMSPDQSRLLVHRWCKPFSYLVPNG